MVSLMLDELAMLKLSYTQHVPSPVKRLSSANPSNFHSTAQVMREHFQDTITKQRSQMTAISADTTSVAMRRASTGTTSGLIKYGTVAGVCVHECLPRQDALTLYIPLRSRLCTQNFRNTLPTHSQAPQMHAVHAPSYVSLSHTIAKAQARACPTQPHIKHAHGSTRIATVLPRHKQHDPASPVSQATISRRIGVILREAPHIAAF